MPNNVIKNIKLAMYIYKYCRLNFYIRVVSIHIIFTASRLLGDRETCLPGGWPLLQQKISEFTLQRSRIFCLLVD